MPAMTPVPDTSLERRTLTAITSTLKKHFAIPKDKQWFLDFAAQSIEVELSARQPSSAPPPAAAGDTKTKHQPHTPHPTLNTPPTPQAEPTPMPWFPEDLPQTATEAEALWGPLIYDNLDDVDPGDVTAFSEDLLKALAQIAAEEEEEGGLASDDGSEEGGEGACEMCERVMPLTKHHLIPRDVHKEWRKKGATFDQLQAGAMICRSCHSAVHRVADNKTLAMRFDTVQKLMQVESLQRHVGWARKQKVMIRPERSTRFRPRH